MPRLNKSKRHNKMFLFSVPVKPTRQQDTANLFFVKSFPLSRKHGRPRVDQHAVMRWIISNPSRASIVWRQLVKPDVEEGDVLFVSSVRNSNSHPDLLLTQQQHHPLFQITPVLNTGLLLSEPLQLYKGYNAI